MKWHDSNKLLNHLLLFKQKGFTFVELLIALLVVTLFVSFALQGMVLASLAQIRAKERAEASLAIQRNLELVKVEAANYLQPISGETEEQKRTRDARCSAPSQDQGMAAGLDAAISSNPNLEIPNNKFRAAASNRSYNFTRKITVATQNVLEIRYEITDPVTSNILAELSAEVSPDVFLQCP